MEIVLAFAEAELSVMVLLGGTALNPGLPLTDNQKTRNAQINSNEKEKKKAAAVIAKAATAQAQQYAGVQQWGTVAGAWDQNKPKWSFPHCKWAQPCPDWNNGLCKKGVSCLLQHKSIDMNSSHCVYCNSTAHINKEPRQKNSVD